MRTKNNVASRMLNTNTCDCAQPYCKLSFAREYQLPQMNQNLPRRGCSRVRLDTPPTLQLLGLTTKLGVFLILFLLGGDGERELELGSHRELLRSLSVDEPAPEEKLVAEDDD
jgi:hypothetical protein